MKKTTPKPKRKQQQRRKNKPLFGVRAYFRNNPRKTITLTAFLLVFGIAGSIFLYLVFAGSFSASGEQDQFDRINIYRGKNGLAPVARSACLTNIAREWSEHMAGFGKLHHSDGSDGKTIIHQGDPGLIALTNKYCGTTNGSWSRLGENVGVGGSSEAIFNAFINSDGHRTNIIGQYNLAGTGAYTDDSGHLWVTQIFAECKGCGGDWTRSPDPPGVTSSLATMYGVGVAVKRGTVGYWLTNSAGKVVGYNGAAHLGDLQNKPINKPIVGMASTPTGNGYWLVGSDGGIFSYGDAKFFGSTGGTRLNKPIVGMNSTPTGNGYWLVASDGGIFAYGDAKFFGSTGGTRLNKPIVGMASTPSGNGYWLVGSDGGIFSYGDAKFFGSTGGTTLNKPIVAMASTRTGAGYWLVASDGGIFAYGEAKFHGSTGSLALTKPISGLVVAADGNGYMIIQSDGTALTYGSAIQVFGITLTNTSTKDTTPPSVPQNLSASAVSASQVNLSWTASTDNVGVTGYRIYRSDKGLAYIATTTGVNFSNMGLNAGTTYKYYVTAIDAAGNSSQFSKEASITTPAATTKPTTPECSDGIDNDGNGITDYPYEDPNWCSDASDPTESMN